MDENNPDYWMVHYEMWRNIANDPLHSLRPRNMPPVSAFIAGNPYVKKVIERPKIMEIA